MLGEGLGTCSSLSQSSGFLELCWDSGAPGLVLRVQRASRDSSCSKKASKTWVVRAEWGKPGRDWLGCYFQQGIGAGGPSQKERRVEPGALQE